MGTRSVTRFIEKSKDNEGKDKETVLVAIYQQYDGYPSCVGLEIAEFLKDMKMVNGISPKDEGKMSNGLGCLSAQFIAHIKTGVGGIYITNPEDSQQYNYDIIVEWEGKGWDSKPKQPVMRIDLCVYDEEKDEDNEFTFEGTPEEFIEGVKKEEIQ